MPSTPLAVDLFAKKYDLCSENLAVYGQRASDSSLRQTSTLQRIESTKCDYSARGEREVFSQFTNP